MMLPINTISSDWGTYETRGGEGLESYMKLARMMNEM